MNLNALRHFYWVVRENGFSAASRALRVSQPGITRSVKALEDELGGQLFDRYPGKLKLSSLGSTVFRHCLSIFEAEDFIAALKPDGQVAVEGSLDLAASDAVVEHILKPKLLEFSKSFPKVYWRVSTGPTGDMLSRIEAGKIDLGLFFHVPHFDNLAIEVKNILSVRFRLVVLAKETKNSRVLESFIGSREIDSLDSRKYPTLDKLKKLHPKAKIQYSSNLLSFHKDLVLAGLGVSVLPEFMVQPELKKGILTDLLPKENLQFQLKLVRSTRRAQKIVSREFQTLLAHTKT